MGAAKRYPREDVGFGVTSGVVEYGCGVLNGGNAGKEMQSLIYSCCDERECTLKL